MHYKILKRNEENRGKRLLAEQILEAAAQYRGMKPPLPRIHFIAESGTGAIESERPLWGLQQAGEIYLLCGLTAHEMVRTIAHEIDHVAAYRRGSYSPTVERRAEMFERDFSELFRNEDPISLSRELFRFLHGYEVTA